MSNDPDHKKVTLESLTISAGVVKVDDGTENSKWYLVSYYDAPKEVDDVFVGIMRRNGEMKIKSVCSVEKEYADLAAAEKYVHAYLSLNNLALYVSAFTRPAFTQRKEEFASLYHQEQKKMREDGSASLLLSDPLFAASELSGLLHLTYETVIASLPHRH